MTNKNIQPQASTISVSKNFEKFINSVDSDEKIYSTTEILNLSKSADNEITGFPSILLSLELINQIALLFPVIYENPQFNRSTFVGMLKVTTPELFFECDSNFNYHRNKSGGKKCHDSFKAQKGFRDSLEHGLYNLIYEEKDNELYYCFRYNQGNGIKYAKIPFKQLLSMIDDMISTGLDERNRYATALVNNMKLLMTLMEQSDKTIGKTINDYQNKFPSLNNVLIVNEHNKKNLLNDMKTASTCSLFYATYQKELENQFGPSIFQLKYKDLNNERIEENVLNNNYLDLSVLPLSWEFKGADIFIENEDKDILKETIPKYIKLHNENLNNYKKGLITFEEFNKRNKELSEMQTKILEFKVKIYILHHIRNSFAHGRIVFGDYKIHFIDKLPNSNTSTYRNSIEKEIFRKIVSHEPIEKIVNWLANVS